MNCNKVLIHDSARPLASNSLIKRLLKSLDKYHSCAPFIINNAFIKNKRVMVTIPNPNKGETKRPFIRVTAKEAGWKKPEPYRMKQD